MLKGIYVKNGLLFKFKNGRGWFYKFGIFSFLLIN